MVGLNFLRRKDEALAGDFKITLGAQGNAADHVGHGWGEIGPDFHRMCGTRSEIWLEHPAPEKTFRLELDIEAETAQLVSVSVRGQVVGRAALIGRQGIACHVPGGLVARKGPVRVALLHEDAALPPAWAEQLQRPHAPLRCYALALRRADAADGVLRRGGLSMEEMAERAGEPPEKFMCRFESLGDNCEFGLVQRLCGADPLGLFRFGAPRLHKLVYCLADRFESLGRVENMDFLLNEGPRREYAMREKSIGMTYHTFLYEHEVDESELLQKQSARLRWLARELKEDLLEAQKIFVWKSTSRFVAEDEILGLHEVMLEYGENTLLWVQPATPADPPGTVSWLQPGLLKAHVHRIAPPQNAHDIDLEPWLEVCATAAQMVREGAGARTERPPRQRPPAALEARAVPGVAHIQNEGDRASGANGWLGHRGSAHAIEGFVLHADPALPMQGLTYQAVLADGSLSEPASFGQYRGTRGKNQPVLGFLVHVESHLAEIIRVHYSATFVDGTRLNAVPSPTPCKALSGSALEAFKIEVFPLTKQT